MRCAALGLPAAERQAKVTLADGVSIHPDLWWPSRHLVVEVDHVSWHGGRLDAQYDKRRDRQVARLGIQTLRVTDEDLTHRFHATIHEILAVAKLRATPTGR